MPYTIYARMKRAGKQKKEDLLPVPFSLERRPDTVRELLTELVRLSVGQYNERRDDGRLLPWLTRESIGDQTLAGKVSFGTRGGSDADPDRAVESAISCFEDGIYRVFDGEEELTDLEQALSWDEEGQRVFTFIRLTMLSGW